MKGNDNQILQSFLFSFFLSPGYVIFSCNAKSGRLQCEICSSKKNINKKKYHHAFEALFDCFSSCILNFDSFLSAVTLNLIMKKARSIQLQWIIFHTFLIIDLKFKNVLQIGQKSEAKRISYNNPPIFLILFRYDQD